MGILKNSMGEFLDIFGIISTEMYSILKFQWKKSGFSKLSPHCHNKKNLPTRECAAMVCVLKYLPNPKSPNFTIPVAVMNTFAGLIS